MEFDNARQDSEIQSERTVEIPCDSQSDSSKSFLLQFDDHAAFHLVNFYEPETVDGQVFRWSEPVAMVRLDVPPSDYEVTIETGLLRCGGLSFPFKLFWNDQQLDRQNISIQEGKIVFTVPRESFIRNDEQRLTFSCKPLNAENGRRQLGLPVQWIRLQQTGSTDPEFSNPTKTRSRLWKRKASVPKYRRLLGMKAPSPVMPIWELKLPNSSTSLRGNESSQKETADCTESDLVIVSSVEINSRHGTGLLIQYMFEDFSQITTVSSQRCFHGDRVRSAQHFEVPFEDLERYQIYELVLEWFKAAPPKRAYIVPYYKTELLVAIALADLFGTEVCLHIMDDQCLFEEEIPIDLLEEAMSKSGLIFVISPEMRDAYCERFDYPIYILPPVVPEAMIRRSSSDENVLERTNEIDASSVHKIINKFRRSNEISSDRGIIIGNIWNEKWLAQLQTTIRESGYEVDWYSNNPDAIMLSSQRDQLASSGIHLKKPLWGEDLVQELRRRPYAIMPSGMLGKDEERESLARLSLPSRLPFVMSVSNIPIVVLGSPETAAAKFVQRFELGAVVDYEPEQFKKAVDRLLQPETSLDIQQRSRSLSTTFSARNLDGWLNESIHLQQPVDNRFEAVFSGRPISCSPATNLARRSNWNKEDLWKILRRLKKQGVEFDQVVDVGAGDGSWSWTASQVYPDSRYVLIEPLLSRYSEQDRQQYIKSLKNPEIVELTLCDHQGETEFGDEASPVNQHQINSFNGLSTFARQSLRVSTLDELAAERDLTGAAILKIDARYAEHLVVAGAVDFIKEHVQVIFLTVDLSPKHATAKSYAEFLMLMDSLEFQLIDESEAKRCPKSEILLSKNLIFAKRELTQKKLAA